MSELVFEATQEGDGGYTAECLTENIFTQGDTLEELRRNVLDATAAYSFDRHAPERICLHVDRMRPLKNSEPAQSQRKIRM